MIKFTAGAILLVAVFNIIYAGLTVTLTYETYLKACASGLMIGAVAIPLLGAAIMDIYGKEFSTGAKYASAVLALYLLGLTLTFAIMNVNL